VKNEYEESVCNGEFIGSFENENCKGRPPPESTHVPNGPFSRQQVNELYFANKSKEMGISTAEETLTSLALSMAPVSQEEREMLTAKINQSMMAIADPEGLKRNICSKYSSSNNVLAVLNALSSRTNS
jgi:hypothetical protein